MLLKAENGFCLFWRNTLPYISFCIITNAWNPLSTGSPWQWVCTCALAAELGRASGRKLNIIPPTTHNACFSVCGGFFPLNQLLQAATQRYLMLVAWIWNECSKLEVKVLGEKKKYRHTELCITTRCLPAPHRCSQSAREQVMLTNRNQLQEQSIAQRVLWNKSPQ